MNVGRTAAGLVAAAALLAGCSVTIGGSGTPGARPGTSSHPDFPSTSANSQAPAQLPTPPTTPPSTPPSTGPTLLQRDARLTAQTNGQPHVAVGVPGGEEAAVWDTAGGITFWRSQGTNVDWAQIGSSRYPQPVTGAPGVGVNGTLLTNMAHATFIVTGQFTTDNSGLAVAYTTGSKGWGVIKAEPDGNIGPSGQPVGSDRIGLSRGLSFADGELVTADCPQNRPIAGCGGHEVIKRWIWTGSDFRRTK